MTGNAAAINEGAVGRLQVEHAQTVVGQFHDAVRARNARIGEDDIGRRRAPNLEAGATDDEALLGAIANLQVEEMKLFGRLLGRTAMPVNLGSRSVSIVVERWSGVGLWC